MTYKQIITAIAAAAGSGAALTLGHYTITSDVIKDLCNIALVVIPLLGTLYTDAKMASKTTTSTTSTTTTGDVTPTTSTPTSGGSSTNAS